MRKYLTGTDPSRYPHGSKGWPSSKNAPIVSKESLPDTGWKASRLYGDADSGISSNYTYTTSVNLEGSTRTINGVTFSGTTQRSGGGWNLGGFTSAIPANHSGLNSSVTGNIGALLHNDGFKYSGTQRLTISGLSSGNTYVLAMYSQAWGGNRTNTVTCSDLNETLTINECLYDGQTPDGLLIECTYIANGTTADFTFSGNSWHLHAFSNREATNGWSITRGNLATNDLSVNIGGIGGTKTATHSTALSTDNQWHHIVSTYDGGTRKIYLDGTEVSSASASGAVASTAATLLLGASDMNDTAGTVAAAKHSGVKLDEVRFYSSGLSSTQVAALYNFGKGDIGNIGEFATLPAKISGTTGTALSSTVTAGFPNAYYEAVNLTPGLGINSATGEISGTPTVGGVGSITVIAKNAAGKRAVSTIPYDSNPTGPAFSFPTLSPGSDHAVIMGEITHSGGEENVVDMVWSSNSTLINTQFADLGSIDTGSNKYYQRLDDLSNLNLSNLTLWLDADDNTTLFADSNLTTAVSSTVGGWQDKSGNGNHATQATSSSKPTYTVSNSLLNNKSSVSSSSQNGSIGLDLPSISLQEIFVVAYYKDGSDSTFDDYNTLISGPGSSGAYRIFGSTNSANWHAGNSQWNFNDNGNFKNGATSSNDTVLPMPATLLRFTSSAPRTEIRGILYNLGVDSRGWIGGVGEIIGLSATSSTSERQKIEGYLAHKWGLSLTNDHPYKVSPPLTWSSSLQSSQDLVSGATNIGTGKEGFYGTTISGLTAGETYHYRIRSQGKLNPKGISGSNLNLWLDADDTSTITHSSNAVSKWQDKSGNGKHATQATSSSKPTYSISDSLLKNKSSVSSSSQNGSIGLDLPSISLQEIFVVAYYKDGSDNSFDNYNTLISGPGSRGLYRIMGNQNTANWITSSNFNDDGTFKNGAISSNTTALPMPATLLRFTSSAARTETRGILYNTQHTDRGWIGGVGEIIGLSATSSTSERQKIEGYLAHKWGLSLASGHPYGLSAPSSQTTWSAVQSFTTPTNVTVPVLRITLHRQPHYNHSRP
jgi:hypothetical protein